MNRFAVGYIGISAIGGIGAITYALLNLSESTVHIEVLITLVVLCGLAQAASVSLFPGSSVSIAYAVSFIALLLYGPTGGILVNLGGAAVQALYPRRRVWYKTLFNTSTFTVSAALAGVTYEMTGGIWPISGLTSTFALGAAAIVYFLVNTAMISLVVSLTTGSDFRTIFTRGYEWLILHHLTGAAISLMAALGYQSMGWIGLLMFSLPLLMPWASTRMYVAQIKTVMARDADLEALNAKLEEANTNLQRRLEEMNAFYRIGLVLNQSQELHKILDYVVKSVAELTKANGVAVFIFDGEQNSLLLASHEGLSQDYLQRPELSLDGPAMRAIAARRRIVVDGDAMNPDLLSAAAARDGVMAAACLPLTVGDDVVGALDITITERHVFTPNELTVLETFAELAAAGIHSARLNEQVHSSYLNTMAALIAIVEAKDPYTKGHSERVRDLALLIGTRMKLAPQELKRLELAALFHDIGKIGIPESILCKNGPLTDDERQMVKHHPALAENILKHLPAFAETIPIIRSHHERPDGKGYPDGLSTDIPKLSAIISVADAYDAMISDRPYRKAEGRRYALAELRSGAGTEFNADVVDAFMKAIEPEIEMGPHSAIPLIRLPRLAPPIHGHLWRPFSDGEWI